MLHMYFVLAIVGDKKEGENWVLSSWNSIWLARYGFYANHK